MRFLNQRHSPRPPGDGRFVGIAGAAALASFGAAKLASFGAAKLASFGTSDNRHRPTRYPMGSLIVTGPIEGAISHTINREHSSKAFQITIGFVSHNGLDGGTRRVIFVQPGRPRPPWSLKVKRSPTGFGRRVDPPGSFRMRRAVTACANAAGH